MATIPDFKAKGKRCGGRGKGKGGGGRGEGEGGGKGGGGGELGIESRHGMRNDYNNH